MTELMGPRPIMDLLAEVEKIFDSPHENELLMKNIKHQIQMNPMRQALHEILCEKKEQTALSHNMMRDDMHNKEKNERFDNMLRARGMIGPDVSHALVSEVVGSEQEEYRQKLVQVRQCYEERMTEVAKKQEEFSSTVQIIVRRQSEFRPIAQQEIEKVAQLVASKFYQIPLKLKQSACEAVINLQKRYCDARRKRKNFPKNATEILNDYFRSNLEHPYPTEEMKHSLAHRCNMTVAQVSNWFGNKRIRYKKSKARDLEQAGDARRNMAAAAAAAITTSPFLIPNSFPGIMNTYQMMMPGSQNFPMGMNFPPCNPEMMMQYQQSMQNISQAQ